MACPKCGKPLGVLATVLPQLVFGGGLVLIWLMMQLVTALKG